MIINPHAEEAWQGSNNQVFNVITDRQPNNSLTSTVLVLKKPTQLTFTGSRDELR
jgi:hypothetical protein